MTDTTPLGLIVVRLKVPVKNMPVGTELGYKDVPDAIAALGSAAFFDVVRDQQGNPIPPLTPEEIEEAQRAAQRRAKSRRLILGADFDPLWNRVDGIPDAGELEQMRQDVEAVADVPPRVEAVETKVERVDPGSVGSDFTALIYRNGQPRTGRLGFIDVDWFPGVTSYPAGTAYSAMTDSAQGIRDALAVGKSFGFEVRASGTYRIDSTVTVDYDRAAIDFGNATFVCNDTALVVLRVGTMASPSIKWCDITTPSVIQAAKTGTGWTGTSIGIELANLQRSMIQMPGKIEGFTEGLRCTGYGSSGFVYNTVHLPHLSNNKINLHLTTTGTTTSDSWINENLFIGGSCSHVSSEGTPAAGTRHILLTTTGQYQVNNNTWIGTSLETPGVAEYQVESIGAVRNRWIGCRWEATGGTARIFWNQKDATYNSRDNIIDGGYGAEAIAHTVSANSTRNSVINTLSNIMHGAGPNGMLHLRNSTGSTVPTLAIYDSDPMSAAATAWRVQIGPTYLRSKLAADAAQRFQITLPTGEIAWGTSAGTNDTTLSRGAADRLTMGDGDAFRVGAIATLPAASAAWRGYMYRVEGGAGVADGTYICRKTAADTYEWVNLTP